MTLREIVNELRAQGHQVEIYNRKDGGILVKSIDGMSFKAAEGNTLARQMGKSLGLSTDLSTARKTQLKIIKPKGKRTPIPKAFVVKLKKVQKAYNVNKVPISQGRITKKVLRQVLEEEGEEAARKKLTAAQRYAEGFATNTTIDAFITAIEQRRKLFTKGSQVAEELKKLENDVKMSSGIIKDEYIYPAYKRLYDIDKQNPLDVIADVRKILRLW